MYLYFICLCPHTNKIPKLKYKCPKLKVENIFVYEEPNETAHKKETELPFTKPERVLSGQNRAQMRRFFFPKRNNDQFFNRIQKCLFTFMRTCFKVYTIYK